MVNRYENRFTSMLLEAKKNKMAIGAFNYFNGQSMRGVIMASNIVGVPVILQASAGTVKRLTAKQLAGMTLSARDMCENGFALHLDHCRDDAIAKACVDNGWDSIMVDFSNLPLEENIKRTRAMVEYAHDRGVTVEGEVGAIFGVEDDIVSDNAHPATYEDTMEFIEKTGVDAIAPAIGTAHGVYKSTPKLNFELIEQIGALDIPLVVHGGTGLSDETFRKVIELGAAKVNISTALKYSYIESIQAHLPEHNMSSPMDMDKAVEAGICATAERLIRLFAGK